MFTTFVGSAVGREIKLEVPAAEKVLDGVLRCREQFSLSICDE